MKFRGASLHEQVCCNLFSRDGCSSSSKNHAERKKEVETEILAKRAHLNMRVKGITHSSCSAKSVGDQFLFFLLF